MSKLSRVLLFVLLVVLAPKTIVLVGLMGAGKICSMEHCAACSIS